jgi:hypothetical protein
MAASEALLAASGWLELGLPDEALRELERLPADEWMRREALEVKLLAQMDCQLWNPAADTARLLCVRAHNEPLFFLRAAFCLHETGDTLAACHWLLRGPRRLFLMPVFHYNLACYLWALGEGKRARHHLCEAIRMDKSLLHTALDDRDLAGLEP